MATNRPHILAACRCGDVPTIATALTTDPTLLHTIRDSYGQPPLLIAAENGRTALVRYLLTLPATDVNIKDNHSRSAIHHAIRAEGLAGVEVITALLEAGADVNAKDDEGLTPLMSACWRNQSDMVKVLTRWPGVDLNVQDEEYGRTALRWAVENGEEGEAARTLVVEGEGKVDLEIRDKEGETAIVAALTRHMDSFGAWVLEKGADPNVRGVCGQTPLWLASSKGLVATVKALVQRGDVGVNATDLEAERKGCDGCGVGGVLKAIAAAFGTHLADKYGSTPLAEACFGGHEEIVKLLLATGKCDLNSRDHCQCTPLARAVGGGHLNIVELLLNTEGVDADVKDHRGNSLLALAAESGREDIVRMFLERKIGGDVDWRNGSGQTALTNAARSGHAAIVEMLIKAGAEYNMQDKMGFSPLALAARDGRQEVVRVLLKQPGIKANTEDISGRGPLHWAISLGRLETTERLVADPRVDVTLKDGSGWSPILIASSKNKMDILSLLLRDGRGDVNAADEGNWTPLISASANGHIEVVRMLLGVKGVGINDCNLFGRTPLLAAVCQDHKEVAKLLLAHEDIDTNCKDSEGRTPLSWAAEKGDSEIVDALLKNKLTDMVLEDGEGLTPQDYAEKGGHAVLFTKLSAAKAFR